MYQQVRTAYKACHDPEYIYRERERERERERVIDLN
jgi:hypothetical protein